MFGLEGVWEEVISGESRCFHGWSWNNTSESGKRERKRGFCGLKIRN